MFGAGWERDASHAPSGHDFSLQAAWAGLSLRLLVCDRNLSHILGDRPRGAQGAPVPTVVLPTKNGRCLPTAWPSTRIPRVKEFYSHPAHLSESDIAYPRVVSQCKVGAKRPLKFLKCHECVLRFVEVRPKFIGSLFGSHESRTLMLGWIAPSPPRCRLWHDALYVIVRSPIRGHPRASWPRRRCARSVAYAG